MKKALCEDNIEKVLDRSSLAIEKLDDIMEALKQKAESEAFEEREGLQEVVNILETSKNMFEDFLPLRMEFNSSFIEKNLPFLKKEIENKEEKEEDKKKKMN